MVAERSSMPCPFSPCSICESLHIGQHMDKHCSNYSYALQLLRFSRATMVDHRHRFTHAQHGTVGYDMNVEPNMLGPLCRHLLPTVRHDTPPLHEMAHPAPRGQTECRKVAEAFSRVCCASSSPVWSSLLSSFTRIRPSVFCPVNCFSVHAVL